MRLFTYVVIGTVIGWMIGLDPGGLTALLTVMAATTGIGEASNVGKRATFKKEAKDDA